MGFHQNERDSAKLEFSTTFCVYLHDYHVWGPFLGIMLLIPFLQWGVRAVRHPASQHALRRGNPGGQSESCRRIILHDKKQELAHV